jgi:tetratricopeptide (TPR) repeat protein
MESQRPLMPPTTLCIVARSMRRHSEHSELGGGDPAGFAVGAGGEAPRGPRGIERTRIARSIAPILRVVLASSAVLASVAALAGCEQLDGRNRNKQGLRLFRETQFIDAAAQFQRALGEVEDSPIVHYNLGLAYSKVTKNGYDGPVLLGLQGDFVCQTLPGVKIMQAGACVKEGDRHFAECGSAKTAPIEKDLADLKAQLAAATDDAKKKELKAQIDDRQQDVARYTCGPSFRCVEGPFCALPSPELADLAAQHFQIWIKAQPSDDEIKKKLAAASERLDEAKKSGNNSAISNAQREVDDLQTKDQTRKLMTLLWTDSDQFQKAIDYWEGLLKEKPNDAEIMGNLAGIHLKAGDWRKSIDWYNKVAEVTNDPSSKVVTYNYIGNVAWQKLNSRTLIGAEAIELADRGIGALQRGAEVQPKNARLVGMQASIYNFRSTAHGASWAAAIDRASAQDLLKLSRVLVDEAKKAQGQPPGAPETPAPPAGTPPAGTPPAGSAAPPATPSGGSAAPPAGSAAPPAAPAAPPAAAPATHPAAPATHPAPPPPAPAPATPPAPQAPAAAPETPPAAVPAAPPAEAPASPPAAPATGAPAEKSGG